MDLLICHNWAVKMVSVAQETRDTYTQHMYRGTVSVKYNWLEVSKRSKGDFNPARKCVNTLAPGLRLHLLCCLKVKLKQSATFWLFFPS